jgi:hypothetical protein
MATTTTNYGFDVPQSSDLVKNGATQIALLGQDLDTFLFRPFTRNAVLNSGFQVAQRGTSFTLAGGYNYGLDRWQYFTNSVGSQVVSQQATGDTTNLPNIQYCLRYQRPNASTNTGALYLSQAIETLNARAFAGKGVTLSFYARKGANWSATSSKIEALLYSGTGTDQNNTSTGFTGVATTIYSESTLTTTWQRFSYTGTVASTATELAIQFNGFPTGTAGAADYFEVTGVQLEVGSQESPYTPATPTYATELAACQRYYYRKNSEVNGGLFGIGQCYTTTVASVYSAHPVTMRTIPSIAQNGSALTIANGNRVNTTSFANSGSTTNSFGADVTVASGLVIGNATIFLGASNLTTYYIEASAEL